MAQFSDSTPLGTLPNGDQVHRYALSNKHGIRVHILSLGGIIQQLFVPDAEGNIDNVVLGFDALSDYLADDAYIGALVGRYANRIHRGKFQMEGKTVQVATNHGDHHLHGGFKGFNRKIWKVSPQPVANGSALQLAYLSPDGEEGFPGAVDVRVLYSLTDENVFTIDYQATTEQTTLFNPTQHSYFNLSGKPLPVDDHQLQLNANRVLEVNNDLLPTGKLLPIEKTVFDFRSPQKLANGLHPLAKALAPTNGWDHCFAHSTQQPLQAKLFHPKSGRSLIITTEAPGLQVYTGNHLSAPFRAYQAICLEDQCWPDSPNHPHFPTALLRAGEIFSRRTQWQFSWT